MPAPLTGFLGLGSNLGDRLDYLKRAVAMLQATRRLRVTAASSVYETAPWGYTSQHLYLNAVLSLAWGGTPLGLRQVCYRIEAALGRHPRGAPRGVGDQEAEQYTDRTIDLDLLWLEGVQSQDARLVLPHPLAQHRAFVLVPWAELAPELVLDGLPLAAWVQQLPPSELAGIRLMPQANVLETV